jgi:hypothetical protein
MQIIPSTFASVADKGWDINNPVDNARAGIRYLSQMLKDAGGDSRLAAIGYYGGPGAIAKAKKGVAVSDPRNPNAPDTFGYADSVMSRIGNGIADALIPAAQADELPKWMPPSTDKPIDSSHPAWSPPASDTQSRGNEPKMPPGFTPINQDSGPIPNTPAPVDPQQAAFKGTLRSVFDPSSAEGALAGEGSGVAKVGLGALHWLGKGLDAIGLDSAGNGLLGISDAGSKRVNDFVAPYRKDAPFSTGAGELGGEVFATGPVGGLLGKGVETVAPLLGNLAPYVSQLGNAVRSGGLTLGAGPISGGLGGLLMRGAGGALTGGAQAGLVNPDDVGRGALLGFGTPAAISGVRRLVRGVAPTVGAIPAPKLDTLRDANQAGYVVPPSSVKPTFTNKTLESIAGKIATAQTASVKNQAVTDALVRKTLGLPDDAPLTPEVLKAARASDYQAGYEPLRNLGMVPADTTFNQALDDIANRYKGNGTIPAIENSQIQQLVGAHKSTGFDSSDAVEAIRILRENADEAFRKGENALAKAYRGVADAYEQQLERATAAVNPQMLDAYRAARTNIAKNFSISKALRSDGNVDAAKLVSDLKKGKLSGDLKLIARFADSFPKAVQPTATVAGPGVHNLKTWGAGMLGTLGYGFGGPGGALLSAAPFVVPPAVRNGLLSSPVQGLLGRTPAPSLLGAALNSQTLGGLLGRTAPLLGAQ